MSPAIPTYSTGLDGCLSYYVCTNINIRCAGISAHPFATNAPLPPPPEALVLGFYQQHVVRGELPVLNSSAVSN